ncbi:uncharacterized protein L969DRAFT_95801 [Mixia osmundae IAM 14324]|uniref:Uncharacterized protein n=1 Tax=Mixia osmundae (strain CBS 9802 / IAM 14324 / JCM 22182 / KY 12970) TaxID=764103 RepID=G7DSJ0_MIXOS|nr:uncharacterized protein L969DRAFT_95801 [Mixia osmundae IAM 14324]KEI37952.1 hypothetical protein L969DRAFT_95801 [Mixia osmundae IAM 14324]GAA93550.1 hypothetical protein E5Q_00194 [Mixia osmundae IAM 14324]
MQNTAYTSAPFQQSYVEMPAQQVYYQQPVYMMSQPQTPADEMAPTARSGQYTCRKCGNATRSSRLVCSTCCARRRLEKDGSGRNQKVATIQPEMQPSPPTQSESVMPGQAPTPAGFDGALPSPAYSPVANGQIAQGIEQASYVANTAQSVPQSPAIPQSPVGSAQPQQNGQAPPLQNGQAQSQQFGQVQQQYTDQMQPLQNDQVQAHQTGQTQLQQTSQTQPQTSYFMPQAQQYVQTGQAPEMVAVQPQLMTQGRQHVTFAVPQADQQPSGQQQVQPAQTQTDGNTTLAPTQQLANGQQIVYVMQQPQPQYQPQPQSQPQYQQFVESGQTPQPMYAVAQPPYPSDGQPQVSYIMPQTQQYGQYVAYQPVLGPQTPADEMSMYQSELSQSRLGKYICRRCGGSTRSSKLVCSKCHYSRRA